MPRTPGPERCGTECTSLLSDTLEPPDCTATTQLSRLSLSETSLTEDILLALRDKLQDPTLYASVLDAKISPSSEAGRQEDLYCAPLYSDPLGPT